MTIGGGVAPMLFTPIDVRTLHIRNRVMISPMCQYCAATSIPGDWHFVHLASRAVGGAGVVMSEATAVLPEGRITPFDVGLWNDDQEAAYARIASFINEQGAVAGVQLAHAGRKASHARPWEARRPLELHEGGWEIGGPSAVPWEPGDLLPHAYTASEIDQLIASFRTSTRRALRAGFRVVELHAAHGYLLHSFLSPLSNQRTDGYGGDFAGRCRLLLETVRAVREVWPPELPLFVRLSVSDWIPQGWTVEDSIDLVRLLLPLGVDLIDCSSGGTGPGQSLDVYPGYQVPLAQAVRRETGAATAAVGLISDAEMAEAILVDGDADLVVLGRIALWDPYWPFHAAATLGWNVDLPIQYQRSGIYRASGPAIPAPPRGNGRRSRV